MAKVCFFLAGFEGRGFERMRYTIEFWTPKQEWYNLPSQERERRVEEWNSLLKTLPEAEQARPRLSLCHIRKGQLELLLCQTRAGFELSKMAAGNPKLNWADYFTKVAFTENEASAEEYARRLISN